MVIAVQRPLRNAEANRLAPDDRPVHDWYRFVLSYPPHLVREYLRRLEVSAGQVVLDPFCGTGTTLVECRKQGVGAVGAEANPMAHFASETKTDWSPDPDGLLLHAEGVARQAWERLAQQGVEDTAALTGARPPDGLLTLTPERASLLLTNSISPRPLHKALVLLGCLAEQHDPRFAAHERLALAKTLVFTSSNLAFGPEVGVGPAKTDAPVVTPWLEAVRTMADDLRLVEGRFASGTAVRPDRTCRVYHADARRLDVVLPARSVDAVITSPPYPNEKDYTRTTRLESVLLGFIQSKADLRALKAGLVRSNTRGVYRGDDDHTWISGHGEVERIANEIEARRIALGKTSGFERQYARVTRLYFGGMARHLAALRPVLRPGARLAYVVGDQASYLRVMIRTGQILAGIAQNLGYRMEGIELFRTRLATATREQLREEVVVLRWPGG